LKNIRKDHSFSWWRWKQNLLEDGRPYNLESWPWIPFHTKKNVNICEENIRVKIWVRKI